MVLEVYWGSGSPFAWRVLLALEIKQVPYESKRLSFSEQDLKSAEFLAINPRGKVPAIRDGAFTLYESIAILCYLEEKYPTPVLFGGSAAERGQIWCAIMECVSYLEPQMTRFAGTIFSGQLAEKREEVLQSREVIEQELTRINAVLSHADYLVGSMLSAADIVVYPVIQLLIRVANKDNAEAVAGSLRAMERYYPAIASWFKKIEAIPGYDRTYPPHWL
jgi:glutathione S-transferase